MVVVHLDYKVSSWPWLTKESYGVGGGGGGGGAFGL